MIQSDQVQCYPGIHYGDRKTGNSKIFTKSIIPANVTSLLYHLRRKLRRLSPHFLGQAFQRSWYQHYGTKPEVRNQTWRPPNRKYSYFSSNISAPRRGRNEIRNAIPTLLGPASEWSCCLYSGMKPDVTSQIWRPPNRKYLYLSS